jgi:hypothetical protein
MARDKDTQIADLKECLAGFMVVCKMNGAYISDEMLQWCVTQLKGKQRTPAAVWNDIVADEKP